ncbi:MAG: DUF262 domain-containing protein [Gemmataceae bacterium]|jgi:hypothetical protein|nr:DUF262 domain-containing protein [Gemmataceae bacterium]
MAKTDATVEELVGMIERSELRLPEMQRGYVWKATRVRDLFDSLYRGYPSGSILVWETDEKVATQAFAVNQRESQYKTTRLLLDGQQRLTSLSAVIRGEPIHVRGRKKPIEILFNLDHPENLCVVTEVNEETNTDEEGVSAEMPDSTEDEIQNRFNQMAFVVSSRNLELRPEWVKVTDVFKSDSDVEFLKRAGIKNFDDPRYEKYSQRLKRLRNIRKYTYRIDILERDLSYEEVTEIFVRVNSLGAKLRGSDLALAQITARWRGSLEIFQSFQNQCRQYGFDFDLVVFLKTLIVLASGQSRFNTIGKFLMDELKSAWEESKQAIEYAINFLKMNVGIDSPALLSSYHLLIVVAYWGHIRKYNILPDESHQFRTWLLLVNAKGRYSRGSSESLLDQDIAILRDGGGPKELIDRLRLQVGRLDISVEELEGRNQRSSLFKMMFLAFRSNGAMDWYTQLKIALDHKGTQHQLQFHHIFPKAILKKKSIPDREIDDIANLAFIAGKTNRKISHKPPSEYLSPIIKNSGTRLFETQCIPTESKLLEIENYKLFLSERRKLIVKRLNQFLGTEEHSIEQSQSNKVE